MSCGCGCACLCCHWRHIFGVFVNPQKLTSLFAWSHWQSYQNQMKQGEAPQLTLRQRVSASIWSGRVYRIVWWYLAPGKFFGPKNIKPMTQLSFQHSLWSQFSWLTYDKEKNAMFCTHSLRDATFFEKAHLRITFILYMADHKTAIKVPK